MTNTRLAVAIFTGLLAAAPALAHEIEATIADCACDAACYTDEVSDLSCAGGTVSFSSHGLPDPSHPLMVGITGNNQQMPIPHNLTFSLPLNPALASTPTETRPGAIGVAVNGVPIFSPDTQGPVQAATGRPVSAAAAGELDQCGGHAGRGDDYHYHRAPNCLIDELGAEAVDVRRQPVGYAADGFAILALGWFDPEQGIEAKLDDCRGLTDSAGRYFYNVEHGGDAAVLDCFSGSERPFARDHWDQRQDAAGQDIIGIPVKFTIAAYSNAEVDGQTCYRQIGTLQDEQLLTSTGDVERIAALDGELFHCSPACYGYFAEVGGTGAPGRTVGFATVTSGCPAGLPASATSGNAFAAYAIR